MENEEIRGLMHKKASKDQFMAFVKFKFGDLLLLSLSLSLSRGHLEFSWSTLVWNKGKGRQGKERKRKQGTRKGKHDQVVSTGILAGNLLQV